MKNQSFVYSLHPFTETSQTKLITISAELFLETSNKLKIDYEISGDLSAITWPPALKGSPRQDNLWNHTCLEAFFSASDKGESPYWEMNCSPSGAWNAYEFSSYREGMTHSSDTTVRLDGAQRESTSFLLQVEIENKKAFKFDSFALTAVIEFTDGQKSYWAIRHALEKPDFHHRSGWIKP